MARSLHASLLLGAVACSSGIGGPEPSADKADDVTAAVTPRREVGQGLVPWQHPELWPLSIESSRLIVHYREESERAMADEVLGDLESAWAAQMVRAGSLPPLDDHGIAGPDGRFDVYLWRGLDTLYVDEVAEEPATPYNDWSTFMVLDPWGKYGGAELEANIFHELRHASQAVDDWWEQITAFEAEATAWEVDAFGFARLPDVWRDFQAHPEWTIFRDDGYRTWYMYGGAAFLLYVRDAVFGGDLRYTNDVWHLCRNAPGADTDPAANEPDFADALDAVLAQKGTSFFDQVVGFARARWYTGARANGSLPGGEVMPEVAHGTHARRNGAGRTSVSVSPELLGTSYVLVQRAATDPQTLWLSLSTNNRSSRFVVQTIDGGAPDQRLSLDGGPVAVSFNAAGTLAIAVTALPAADGGYDIDTVSTKPQNASLTFSTTR